MKHSTTALLGDGFGLAFVGVCTFVVFIAILMSIKIIKQAECMVIERFGKYHRTLGSGLNFIIPAMDQPRLIQQRIFRVDTDGNVNVMDINRATIDLREQVYHYARDTVTTKDNKNVWITAGIFFQIVDPLKAIYEVASLPDSIRELHIIFLRNVVGELELNECLASREKISSELGQVLDEVTNKWGVKVNHVGLKDIIPTSNI